VVPSHRDAMDAELADVMRQLTDQLTDAERLQLPGFLRRGPSPSGAASAAQHDHDEGETQCSTILQMLEKLAQPRR
jgi:hypothetical protein